MKFDFERTAAGEQFVIPGTERPRRPSAAKYERDGLQLVIPGAEQVALRQLLERRSALPLAPRRGQRSMCATPLFRTREPKS